MKVLIGWIVVIVVCVGVIGGIYALVHHNNQWNTQRGRGDVSVGHVDTKSRDIYQMPDRFKNVAEVCDKYGNAIVSTTSDGGGSSMFIVKDGCQ